MALRFAAECTQLPKASAVHGYGRGQGRRNVSGLPCSFSLCAHLSSCSSSPGVTPLPRTEPAYSLGKRLGPGGGGVVSPGPASFGGQGSVGHQPLSHTPSAPQVGLPCFFQNGSLVGELLWSWARPRCCDHAHHASLSVSYVHVMGEYVGVEIPGCGRESCGRARVCEVSHAPLARCVRCFMPSLP